MGDSITFGAELADPESESYPAQLGKLLGSNYDVRNFGHNGACITAAVEGKQYADLPEFQAAVNSDPTIVLICLGTNDADPNRWTIAKEDFVKDYRAIIDAFEGKTIYVALPPPAPGNPREPIIAGELREMITNIAKIKGLKVIDFFTPLNVKDGLFPDTLHPNAQGARFMAEAANKVIKSNQL